MRSPEEQEAIDKFEEAVREYTRFYEVEGLIIDWLLVTAEHIAEDDGGSSTGLAMYVSPTQSIYRTSGLANYAKIRVDENMSRREP